MANTQTLVIGAGPAGLAVAAGSTRAARPGCPGLDFDSIPAVRGRQRQQSLIRACSRDSPRGMLFEIGQEALAIAAAIGTRP